MKLKVDADLCQGHGRCYSLYPDLFEADEDGYGTAVDVQLAPRQMKAAEEAIEVCPEAAISLVED